jgi:hypothetical protein
VTSAEIASVLASSVAWAGGFLARVMAGAPGGVGAVRAEVRPAIDRATFNGFWDYIHSNSPYLPAVYNAGGGGSDAWDFIFGSGETIPNTPEWTFETETASLATFPTGWSVPGASPLFFGGQSTSSKCALLWQWSGGGGVLNSVGGDFDQIDGNRVRNGCI